MKERIIGRKSEKILLDKILNSGKPEFVTVCGRRRVGKTFLIREFFEDELVFKTAGLAHESKTRQLSAFYDDLLEAGMEKQEQRPSDWIEAFSLLRQFIKQSDAPRKVVLLDELPWMDTPKSGFLSALEHFWNVWGSNRDDLVLIVCGSATSWMMDKLINNHGGLHNRLTRQLFLEPFMLGECEEFLRHRGFITSRYDIAVLYMILGGIPYYLELLDPSLSLAQNIDQMLFRPNGVLRGEFSNLYAALFRNSEDYIKVVKALSDKRKGLSRNEIIASTGIKSGIGLTTLLSNLESCGFIRRYKSMEAGRRKMELYQLMDFFTIFYFHFIQGGKNTSWENVVGEAKFFSWAGITFELLAVHHIRKIKQALGILGVMSDEYTWQCGDKDHGAQVDLIIDRKDFTVNLCEIKFSISTFSIDKQYEMVLRNKISKFIEFSRNKKSVIPTLVTTYGLEKNMHSGVIARVILLDDLFVQ